MQQQRSADRFALPPPPPAETFPTHQGEGRNSLKGLCAQHTLPKTPQTRGESTHPTLGMPATRLQPSPRQARSGFYTAIAMAAIIIGLAITAFLLWLWDRHRRCSAKVGTVVNTQPCKRTSSQSLHRTKDIDGLETGIIRRGSSEELPGYQESTQRS